MGNFYIYCKNKSRNLNWPVIEESTTNYAYNNAFLPIVIFISVFLLVILLNYTRLGRRMRAVADNPELAASSGINVERVQMTSAFLSAGISGLVEPFSDSPYYLARKQPLLFYYQLLQ